MVKKIYNLSEHFEWVFNVLAVDDVQIPIHVFLVNTVLMRRHSESSFHIISCFY